MAGLAGLAGFPDFAAALVAADDPPVPDPGFAPPSAFDVDVGDAAATCGVSAVRAAARRRASSVIATSASTSTTATAATTPHAGPLDSEGAPVMLTVTTVPGLSALDAA